MEKNLFSHLIVLFCLLIQISSSRLFACKAQGGSCPITIVRHLTWSFHEPSRFCFITFPRSNHKLSFLSLSHNQHLYCPADCKLRDDPLSLMLCTLTYPIRHAHSSIEIRLACRSRVRDERVHQYIHESDPRISMHATKHSNESIHVRLVLFKKYKCIYNVKRLCIMIFFPSI